MVRIIAPHPSGRRGLLYWRADAGYLRMDDARLPFRGNVDVKVMGTHVFIDAIGPAPLRLHVTRALVSPTTEEA